MKINTYYPNINDATSFHRGHGVFAELRKLDPEIEINHQMNISWSLAKGADFTFFQRPFTDSQLDSMKLLRMNNLKIWTDYDDNIINIPSCNFVRKKFGQTRLKENMKIALDMADLVTVSTPKLKEVYDPLCKNPDKIHVVPNAFDDYIFSLDNKLSVKPEKIVFWRGTDSHKEDLLYFEKEIIELAKKHPDFHFIFLGYNPVFLTQKIKNVKIVKSLDIVVYYQYISKLPYFLQIVPLEDNEFNRCKSNIAWLEASYSTGITVAPNWDEWRDGFCQLYKDKEEFFSRCDQMLSNYDNLADENTNKESWDVVKEKFLLSQINKQRVELARAFNEKK